MSKETSRRVLVTRRGGPEVLEVVDGSIPRPAPNEVRVRVEAAGVSAMDLMVRSKTFPGFPKLPFTPGVDVVGLVDAIGEEVSGLEPGQRIAALIGDQGGYAEQVCVPSGVAVPVPDDVDPAEAVCLVANYLTAYSMMHRAADVRSGERVLIHGAAGGVGTALLELGALTGLEMYGTASAANHDLVARLGARPIDYRTEDFVTRIRDITGDGVDVVFDPIGGARQLWRSYQTLRKGGRLVWFGVAGTAQHGVKVIPLSLLARTGLSLIPDGRRVPFPPDSGKPVEWYRETLATLLDYLRAGKLNPLIAARIPLSEAPRAHQILEQGPHHGKVVLINQRRLM